MARSGKPEGHFPFLSPLGEPHGCFEVYQADGGWYWREGTPPGAYGEPHGPFNEPWRAKWDADPWYRDGCTGD